MDMMLASLGAKDAARATSDYLTSVGKRSTEVKKRNAKNVTPAAPRPYCRHKEFLKMPKNSLDAVSKSWL